MSSDRVCSDRVDALRRCTMPERAEAIEQLGALLCAVQAELVDVVTAVSAAQTSLETVMAVRDQVISAYQEIMRMPI